MSRTAARLTGTGTGGDWKTSAPLDRFTRARGQVLKEQIDLFLAGAIFRSLYVGGSEVDGIDGLSVGDVDLRHWIPWEWDNVGNQLTGFSDANGASFIARVRYYLRTTNASVSITPKIVYGTVGSPGTISTVATISGQAACTATSSAYTGTNQIQDVLVTLPSGLKWFKAIATIAGTPATGDQVFIRAEASSYVALP